MTDDGPAASTDDAGMGRMVGLLQMIAALLVVIAIILLLIFVRGPAGQQRSGASVPVAAIVTHA